MARAAALLVAIAALAAGLLLATGRGPEPGPAGPAAPRDVPAAPAAPDPSPGAGAGAATRPGSPPRGSARLAGRVRTDAGAVVEGLALRLWTLDPTLSVDLVVATDADGRFEVVGLPEEFYGWLSLPPGHELPGGGRNTEVEAGDGDVVVIVRRLAAAIGRVLDAAGAPVPGAKVELRWREASGRLGSSRSGAQREGRFAVALPPEPPARATLHVLDPGTGLVREVDVDPARLAGFTDLGDVTLPEGRSVVVRVVGPDGRPAPEPTIRIESTRGTFTGDESGRIPLLLPAGTVEATVSAHGHRSRAIEVPAGAPSPFEARLDRSTRLRVGAFGPDGTPAEGYSLELDADGSLFEGPRRHLDGWELPSPRRGRSGESWFDVDGLRSGVRTTVTLRDRLTGRTVERREITLLEGEWREVRLTELPVGRELRGRVVDAEGKPVAAASVLVGLPGEAARVRLRSDPDGRFRAGGLRAPRVDVLVRCESFVPVRREVDLAAADGELDIVVRPGRTVVVRVVDPAGRAVMPNQVRAEAGGIAFAGRGSREERELDGLPPGPVRVRVEYAGRTFEAVTEEPEVEIRVPATGSLRVRLLNAAEVVVLSAEVVPAAAGGSRLSTGTFFGPAVRFDAVVPGRYRVELRGGRGEEVVAVAEAVRVNPGEETVVELSRDGE